MFIVRHQSVYYPEKLRKKKLDDIKKFIRVGEQLFEDAKVSMEKHWNEFKEILDKKIFQEKNVCFYP